MTLHQGLRTVRYGYILHFDIFLSDMPSPRNPDYFFYLPSQARPLTCLAPRIIILIITIHVPPPWPASPLMKGLLYVISVQKQHAKNAVNHQGTHRI